METKLDSRQGQFPASFPDTFKDFFSMMSEDEDHLDLFSNLLEDKTIPRASKQNQRRCGGSLRCPSTSSNNSVGRSNSFRVNRPNRSSHNSSNSSNNYCKHIKYCCLHQKQYSQNFTEFGYSSPSNDDEEGGSNEITRLGTVKQKSSKCRSSFKDRNFNCDSCEESDTMSTSSSTATIPYTSIARRHHHQKQHQQQHQIHQEREQNQKQFQHLSSIGSKGFYSKDGGLPRIVQQSGLRESLSGIVSGAGVSSSMSGVGGGNSIGNGINAIVSSCNNVSCSNIGRPINTLYNEMNTSSTGTMTKCFSDKLTPSPSRPNTLRGPKSPVLNRRRSSSIAATLLTSDNKLFHNTDDANPWGHSIPHSNTRERLSHVKSPVNPIGIHPPKTNTGVLSLKQAMSGAVSPQYTSSSSLHALHGGGVGGVLCGPGSSNNSAITNTTSITSVATNCAMTPTTGAGQHQFPSSTAEGTSLSTTENTLDSTANSQVNSKTKQRMRTSSMPAENRKPRLADTRRAAIHCADMDIEYYRLRSFSITSHGVCNLGDSMRSRRSRSINSVTSTGTSNSGRDRNNSNTSADVAMESESGDGIGGGGGGGSNSGSIPAYKIAILGASGVGKTALTYQFTTSDYICAYDLSLDDDYGQKTVSVLLDGIETDLEIIDHPACEMSTEAFCSTYNIDLFVVVYSVVDRNSFEAAKKILHYLKDSEMLLTRGAILVGNKTDLERHREVTRQTGRRLAKEIACKFIETSSGLDHNVNELLVGIVAQVKLNPLRLHNLTEKERQRVNLQSTLQKHRRMELPSRKIIKQKSICKDIDDDSKTINSINIQKQQQYHQHTTSSSSIVSSNSTQLTATSSNLKLSGPILKKSSKRSLNLESILKVGESEIDDEDDDGYKPDYRHIRRTREIKKFDDNDDDDDDDGGGKGDDDVVSENRSIISSSRDSLNSPKKRISYDQQKQHKQKQQKQQQKHNQVIMMSTSGNKNQTNLLDDNSSSSKERSITKFSNRTRVFLTSILKFKKNLNVKRRNSSSCSDLFVI